MKILIASPCLGSFGGIESFVFNLAQELQSCQDIECTVCLKKVKGFKLDSSFSKLIDTAKFNVVFVDKASKKLFELIKRADLVHCQNPCIDIVLFAKILNKPLVMTIYNWRRHSFGFRPFLSQLANNLASRSWYISDFVWNSWEPKLKRLNSGKLPIISNLPTDSVPPAQRQGFLFIARWIPNKGLEVLLDAYAQANLDYEAWPLTLVGDGPLRPLVEAKILEQKIEGVVIKGFVDNQTRNNIIRHAKWMVTPPHTNEDLGLTPIEARHVGVPCIITRDGGLSEAGGKYALSCEPGNVEQLKQLLEQAASMDEVSYEKLSNATHEELLEYLKPMSLYIDNYKQVLAEHQIKRLT